MRCENCPALKTEGYEYPESYCSVYPEDEIYDFDDGCGCKHPWNAIKKRMQSNEEAEAHQYDGIVEFYQEQQKKEDTKIRYETEKMRNGCFPFLSVHILSLCLSFPDGFCSV